MPDKAWKAFERRVAKLFKTRRNPLSGINSTITGSDTIHDSFFVECKLRAKCAANSLYQKTKLKAREENKIPILALQQKNSKGFLVCVHSDNLIDFCSLITEQETVKESKADGKEEGKATT